MTQARAFWITGPHEGELRSETLPDVGPDDVWVETLESAVSRGTESLVFGGKIPPSEHERMRAPFQAGWFPAPVKYGYCNVGIVRAGPEALVGQRVFALFPHQDHYVVPAEAVTRVPDAVPTARATLAANMETAVNGIWDAHVSLGDRVCVLGAGVVGCLVAYLAARRLGCAVELVDPDVRKAEIAAGLGVAFRKPDEARGDCDCVFEASGSPLALPRALELAGAEGTIVTLSWYGNARVEVPLGEAFHARRLRIVSSQVGTLPADRRARWNHRRRMSLALELLEDPALDVLLTGASAFEELPTAMASIMDRNAFVLCHRVMYS